MRIFVYEYISGGGLLAAGIDEPVPESLLREGLAMHSAVVADFSAVPGVRVTTLRDGRMKETAENAEGRGGGRPRGQESGARSQQTEGQGEVVGGQVEMRRVQTSKEELAAFDELAAKADGVFVIAPEIGGALLTRCRRVEELGGRLLGPSSEVVRIVADKQITAEWLATANVVVPLGRAVETGERLPVDFPYPAVLKPRDGAGSQDVRYVAEVPSQNDTTVRFPARLEQFCSGMPVSVALICGPKQRITLPSCRQRLSDDGEFRYLGGDCPVAAESLGKRARFLASQAVASLPEPRGYLGVDLVLGEHPDGRDDVVIEINPRLTTSYVGLRQLAEQNLAAVMLDVLDGKEVSLSFRSGRVQFEADGRVVCGSDD